MLADGETPWTPAISIFYGFDKATDMMLKEGLPSIFARHVKIGDFTRSQARARGLELLVKDEKVASNVVTAIKAGDINVSKLRQILREDFKVYIAGGQGKLKAKVFRIGHLGYVAQKDIEEVFKALDKAMPGAKS
jgi:aspartate aminotransferase-like enzyme